MKYIEDIKSAICYYKAMSKLTKIIFTITILYQFLFLGYSTFSLLSSSISFILFTIGTCLFGLIFLFHYKWIQNIKKKRAAIRTYHYMNDLISYSLDQK